MAYTLRDTQTQEHTYTSTHSETHRHRNIHTHVYTLKDTQTQEHTYTSTHMNVCVDVHTIDLFHFPGEADELFHVSFFSSTYSKESKVK